jgi:hypothetical protein
MDGDASFEDFVGGWCLGRHVWSVRNKERSRQMNVDRGGSCKLVMRQGKHYAKKLPGCSL